jgi:hypothetical protein
MGREKKATQSLRKIRAKSGTASTVRAPTTSPSDRAARRRRGGAALGSKVGTGMGSERLLLAALGGETTKAGFWPWFRGLLRCRFREGSFGLLGKAYLGRQVNLMEASPCFIPEIFWNFHLRKR